MRLASCGVLAIDKDMHEDAAKGSNEGVHSQAEALEPGKGSERERQYSEGEDRQAGW